MGWFGGSSSNDKKSDPTQQLEPGLRDYLDKEAPEKYKPTESSSPPPPRRPYRERVGQPEAPKPTTPEAQGDASQPQPDRPTVPSASLFPDGRYAHIWKNYQSLEELEGSSQNPAEKVIGQFKERKSLMRGAALENCAEEHLTLTNCFKTGDFSNRVRARMTMCQLENSKFSRCYTMQGKFLVALGYGADPQNEQKQERIQMHADKLYHQMMDYEAKVAEAKAAGVEPPPRKSLFNPDHAPKSPGNEELELPGGEQIPKGVGEQLKDLTPHERELEIQMIKQRKTQQSKYLEELNPVLQAQAEAKEKRREQLSKWFGPAVGKWITS